MDVIARLKTFARLISLRRIDAVQLAAGDRSIAALGALTLALVLAADRFRAGAGAEWYASGLIGLGWQVLGALAVTWCASRVASPRPPYRAVLLVVAVFLPVALAVLFALEAFAPESVAGWGFIALVGFGLVYLQRALCSLGASRSIPAVAAAAVLAAAFASVGAASFVSAQVWYPATADEDMSAYRRERSERLLFEQPARIDAEAGALAPREPHRANVYFVGFAGFAEQRVFAEEIKFAAEVIGTRYGSADRSVLLLNDRRDSQSKPLATVSGLERALAMVGQSMDVEEDILFLALSSHGSEDPELSVSHGMLPLEQLTGTALRRALDSSGIRWRVIVISACHSGAFIAPLADERTVILTAAAGDKTSFGCSDERELTYFGEAFFRDALPTAASLREAFEDARRRITAREAREGISASDPQAHFGAEIERRWTGIDQAATIAELTPLRRRAGGPSAAVLRRVSDPPSGTS